MIRLAAILTTIGGLILFGYDWKLPYSYTESVIILLGCILLFGPGFVLITAVLNRGINISFDTKYDGKRRK